MDLSKKEMMILGGLMAATAVVYVFLLLPATKERAHLTAEASRLTQQAQMIRQTLKAVPKGREGLAEARSRLGEIRARLLPSVSSLFGTISRPSKRLGIRIVKFTPTSPDTSNYGQVSADLIIEGRYLDLGQYLEELFGGPFLLSVDHLRLASVKPGNSRLRMHVTLKSWMKQESSG
ncbi:MAG: type 4a pilus biogenesis protein PilO [Candidatus Methylomirabilales bacterium]